MPVLPFGGRVYGDRGIFGAGVPGYARSSGYTPSAIPTAVGARYFLNDERSEFDERSDQAIPIAKGNKWDGGRPAYQERVYAAMKKHPLVKQEEVDMVKPRKVA